MEHAHACINHDWLPPSRKTTLQSVWNLHTVYEQAGLSVPNQVQHHLVDACVYTEIGTTT